MYRLGWQKGQHFCSTTITEEKPAGKFKLALDFCQQVLLGQAQEQNKEEQKDARDQVLQEQTVTA